MNENARKFDHRIKNPDPHIVAFLAAIDEIRGVFRVGLRMTPQAIVSLRKSVLVTSAGSSTRIEGSKLSDEEVKKIMQGLNIQKFTDRDSQEVQGYLETLKTIPASRSAKKSAVPPWLTNVRGIPVRGNTPSIDPILINA